MKTLLQLEEAALFGLSIYLFSQTEFAWWWYLVLLLAPDISMLGYLAGTKTGAITYNFFHHKAIAIVVLLAGWYSANEWLALAGIILLGHASMDRLFGYGLKYSDSFQHTHLGWMNQKQADKAVRVNN